MECDSTTTLAARRALPGWRTLALTLTLLIAAAGPIGAIAAGGSDGDGYGAGGEADDRFRDVNKAIDRRAYDSAIALLRQLAEETPDDADVHNLLGFSHRKLGEYDVAFEHYQRALAIDPEHIRAHEYLGELYLQTDRLADAEAQLEKVDDLCSLFCKERRMLKKAIKEYKARNG